MAIAQRRLSSCGVSFFVLRTPLLSFDEGLKLGEGLRASRNDSSEALDDAIEHDRALTRTRYRSLLTRSEVREALLVASPTFESEVGHWIEEPESRRGQRVERTLTCYLYRMLGRPTPFGLFAGSSLGHPGQCTSLRLGEAKHNRRLVAVNPSLLDAAARRLSQAPTLMESLRFRANSSLHRTWAGFRYIARSHDAGRATGYQWLAVEHSDALERMLERAARCEVSLEELFDEASVLMPGIGREEVRFFVGQLLAEGLLESDLEPSVTGDDPLSELVKRSEQLPLSEDDVALIGQVRAQIAELRQSPIGSSLDHYRRSTRKISELVGESTDDQALNVSLVKASSEAVLSERTISLIRSGIELLYRIVPPPVDELTDFKKHFDLRYGQRQVPFLEAVDPEIGIGFPVGDVAPSGATLGGLFDEREKEVAPPWSARDWTLHNLASRTHNGREIDLTEDDLRSLETFDRLPLPKAFAAMLSLSAPPNATEGEIELFMRGVAGPSGANLLGRFCQGNPELTAAVNGHLREEEACDPERIFAEIVHLPPGRDVNVVARPILRSHEIPIGGRSGLPIGQQILPSELSLFLVGDRLVLYCHRLRKEVVPRLTCAHRTARSIGPYRVLALLALQGVAGRLLWDWQGLNALAFLPRLRAGRIVLARARWRLGEHHLQPLLAKGRNEGFRAMIRLRRELELPRWVLLADDDNELPIDLDNVLSVESLISRIRGRNHVTLEELYPTPDNLLATDGSGRFPHQLIVPFSPARSAEPLATLSRLNRSGSNTAVQRTFLPGDHWLTVKLYMGRAMMDRVLVEWLDPWLSVHRKAGAVESWFFIRYRDPDWHLRVRFRGDPRRLLGEVLPSLTEHLRPLVEGRSVHRMTLDTYEREIERYGGHSAIALAEEIFNADSEFALAYLQDQPSGSEDESFTMTGLVSVDALLRDLGLDLQQRLALANSLEGSLKREFRCDGAFEKQLSRRFRASRESLKVALVRSDSAKLIQQRRHHWDAPLRALRGLHEEGALGIEREHLAASLAHMSINRLARTSQREHELIVYSFLRRLNAEKLAFGRDRA